MKVLLSLLLTFTLLVGDLSRDRSLCKNGKYILKQSIGFHDPDGHWEQSNLQMIIREPRLSDDARSSIVSLDIPTGEFRLDRSREAHTSSHLIDKSGIASTLLDGKMETDTALIRKYRLEPVRNSNYRNYYRFMYGLPMILNTEAATMGKITQEHFQGTEAIRIDFELEESMIAKNWTVYFSPTDYQVLGIATNDEGAEEGEYLEFNGTAQVEGMKLPRFRHWYDSNSRDYLGSDILVKTKD